MKNKSDKLRSFLLLFIIIILFAPMIQAKFKFITVSPLKGDIVLKQDSVFSFKGWFSGAFQTAEENYLNENFGFRNICIRVNNQIAFNLFRKAIANGVIIGKENCLYEETYLNAYYGNDFIGIDSITHRMQRLKFLQDTLQKLNKNLILVFAAGKGSFYPEYFPDKYKQAKGKTNYEYHIKLAKEMGLNYIDFNKYFVDNKNKSKYPLYPKNGIHWSYYGECLVADSIIKYIEKLRNIDIPNIYWNDISVEPAKNDDIDIEDGMNLLFNLRKEKMAYPKIQFESDANKIKPSVLVIGDSYYWGMFGFGISNSFSTSNFWYYYSQIYSGSDNSFRESSQVDLMDEIAKHDVIIILGTEATLREFGWGFIEEASKRYHDNNTAMWNDTGFVQEYNEIINGIKSDKVWYDTIIAKALRQNITIDSMLKIDALWVLQNNKKK
jgi:hypothetical protein